MAARVIRIAGVFWVDTASQPSNVHLLLLLYCIRFFKLAFAMLFLRLTFASSFFLFVSFWLSAQCPITVNAGDDIYLCAPAPPTDLNGEISGDYMNFNWSPTVGMTGATTLSPTVTVSQTT
ncbi:MAG: hypothetical protein ABL927_15105, partial [Bdellovibrionales bacterium]